MIMPGRQNGKHAPFESNHCVPAGQLCGSGTQPFPAASAAFPCGHETTHALCNSLQRLPGGHVCGSGTQVPAGFPGSCIFPGGHAAVQLRVEGSQRVGLGQTHPFWASLQTSVLGQA
jgi:hypothetical protein